MPASASSRDRVSWGFFRVDCTLQKCSLPFVLNTDMALGPKCERGLLLLNAVTVVRAAVNYGSIQFEVRK